MKISKLLTLSIFVLVGSSCARSVLDLHKFEPLNIPKNYVCYLSPSHIQIDGVISEKEWGNVAWSDFFGDIEGDSKPEPKYKTRIKMAWDQQYLYIAAELEEPHVWATLTHRDTVIFYDNDFEVFIDPDGDSHLYYELEINALATLWDLLLIKPYRDGGPAVNGWDVAGIKTAVDIQGTINNPEDKDHGWTVEMAIPMSALKECSSSVIPPKNGSQWRINFSRVEWRTQIEDGNYRKIIDPSTGKPFPENNWVWSPQGFINMHMPEKWGIIQFSNAIAGEGVVDFIVPQDLNARWIVRQIYYQEHIYFEKFGTYTSRLKALGMKKRIIQEEGQQLEIISGDHGFTATLKSSEPKLEVTINEEGKVVVSDEENN